MLLRETDRLANHSKIIEYLTKLQEIDPLRLGYYRDLASKWSIEHKLTEWIIASNFCRPLELGNLKLSIICLEQYMTVAEEVDLSGNQIEGKCASKLAYLKSCRALNVSENILTADEAQKWKAF
jgi:geranylgeranyl transferase type-2 subunit alpha